MRTIKTIILSAAAALSLSVAAPAQDASSLSELLRQIERGQTADTAEARRREAEFRSRQSEQQQLLTQARQERAAAEALGSRLEGQFEANNEQLAIKEAELTERLGELKELFGVLQQSAGDLQGTLSSSLTNLQYPDREEFLVELGAKMASSTELA
ncbi:MAG: energy transducer TonB, partial [Pseudomonadota bacterium]